MNGSAHNQEGRERGLLGQRSPRVKGTRRTSGDLRTATVISNAAIPSADRPFAARQAYVMAAVLDEQGNVVPGFEADNCLVQNSDRIDLPLRWKERSTRELAGRAVRLRFFLRSADIFAVTFR